MSYGTSQPLPLSEVLDHAIRCAEGDQNVHKRYYLALDDLLRIKSAILATASEQAPVAITQRWLGDLRDRMEHCVSAADEGVDYAVPREFLDAMTTLGLMKKVGRGKWAPTDEGMAFADNKPTLPVEIYGKFYEVPIPVQLHIIHLRDKLDSPAHTSEARDAEVTDELVEMVAEEFHDWHDGSNLHDAISIALRKGLAAMRQEGGK